jgi:hypothetical protein
MSEIGPNAATRVAVELLTLWIEQDREGAIDHIVRVLSDLDAAGAASIIAGQCNLSASLAFKLAVERGARTVDEATTKVGEILQEAALELEGLPE